ncbi:DUF1801 domain-containing protein [Micrococcales bacterium 31B]|nr:DUF1801 domain-containing protein [Micrococcales bacterium 31B]
MSTDWRPEVVAHLTQLILAADAGVTVESKWKKPSNPDGVPTFTCDGLLCTVETYKDKVKVTFAKGASLDDPTGIFNASLDAGTRRAVDVKQADSLDDAEFVALIRRAIDLNRSK